MGSRVSSTTIGALRMFSTSPKPSTRLEVSTFLVCSRRRMKHRLPSKIGMGSMKSARGDEGRVGAVGQARAGSSGQGHSGPRAHQGGPGERKAGVRRTACAPAVQTDNVPVSFNVGEVLTRFRAYHSCA